MFKRARVSLLAVLALGVAGAAFADTDATPHQIYEAAQAGHLAEAQKMVDQVLLDHPQSATAHFVAAELDARTGDFAGARQQLATAKQLDPAEHFANARAVSELERELAGIRGGASAVTQPFAPAVAHRSTVPWGLIIILAIGAFVLLSIFRGRAQRAAYSQTYGPGGPGLIAPGTPGAPPGYGYGPGYPPPGGGSGLMGNLASGLAIGAGVAAGEELVRHVIDGHSAGAVPPDSNFNDPPANQDMGGNDFGTSDSSSWGDSGGGDSGGWGGDSGGGGGDWT